MEGGVQPQRVLRRERRHAYVFAGKPAGIAGFRSVHNAAVYGDDFGQYPGTRKDSTDAIS